MKVSNDQKEALNQQDQINSKQIKEIDTIYKECANKLALKDAQRIWRQQQRFAEYEDLRDLYKKCIPEISKFELKIMEFQKDIDKYTLVIKNFDEIILQKADKTSI